jgi:hypothetical protein
VRSIYPCNYACHIHKLWSLREERDRRE